MLFAILFVLAVAIVALSVMTEQRRGTARSGLPTTDGRGPGFVSVLPLR